MLRLAQPSACGGSGDLSFAEPFSKKWKPDRSCLTELGEGKHSTYNMSEQRSKAERFCGVTEQMMSLIQTGRFLKSHPMSWK